MRKSIFALGIGILGLSALFFYAEQRQQLSRNQETVRAIEEVLRAQNQALAGRIFEGLGRADRDALLALQRWKRKAKTRSFLADTALTEPDAPQWIIVSGRRIRAAGTADNPLLEDALEQHLRSAARLSLYSSKNKNYLFVNGRLENEPFAAAYSPEAFFSSFLSFDGIRVWLALGDGTVIYHPMGRFIGSSVSNLKPIAAGIKALAEGASASFTKAYLSLDGKEALAAWTPLPSHSLLVGSEWPKAPRTGILLSAFFWFGLAASGLAAFLIGLSFAGGGAVAGSRRMFDEGRLDEDAMEYLEEARSSAEKAVLLAEQKEKEAREALAARQDVLNAQGLLEWKTSMMEEFQRTILPKVTGKQVWTELAELMVSRSPGLGIVFYRYSGASFSLVPETIHGSVALPESAVAYLQDARIFIGNPSYLENLLQTEAFHRWNSKRERHMPLHETEFRAYPIHCSGIRGAMLVYFDRRMNGERELEPAISMLESLLETTSTFCDSLGRLLQSSYANGIAWKALASASNGARNQPRSS